MMNDLRSPRVLISEEQIARRVAELGAQISEDYRGKNPLFVGILRGAFMFLADLARQITIPCAFDFIAVSSYGSGTQTTGIVRILKDLNETVLDRHVVLVEDIVDTGLTLDYLNSFLKGRSPASLATCVLLDKRACRRVEVEARYVAFTIADEFVVGYGLDLDQHYRNIPYVGVFSPDGT